MIWCKYQAKFTVIIAVGLGFDLNCPKPSQWKFRKYTCGTPEKYSCLYDISKGIYVESCSEKKDFVRAGKRYVRRGGSDSYDCSRSRYQPRKFWSNGMSNCEILKSTCREEGQITVNDGTTKNDRACRCDFQKGFEFITNHTYIYACIPSKEDCDCYRTKCDEGQVLTKDFDCTNINMTNMSEVTEKSTEESGEMLPAATYSGKTLYTLNNNGLVGNKSYWSGHIEITVLVLMGMFLTLAVLGIMQACRICIKKRKITKTKNQDDTNRHCVIAPSRLIGFCCANMNRLRQSASKRNERDQADENRYFIVGSAYLEVLTPLFQQKIKENYTRLNFKCLNDFLQCKHVIHILFHLRHRHATCCSDTEICNNHKNLPLNHYQWYQLYTEKSGSDQHYCYCKYTTKDVRLDELDVRLCALILIHCCHLEQPAMEAVRVIGQFNNDYMESNKTAAITKDEYDSFWEELETMVFQLDQTKKEELIHITKRPFDKRRHVKYFKILTGINEISDQIGTTGMMERRKKQSSSPQ